MRAFAFVVAMLWGVASVAEDPTAWLREQPLVLEAYGDSITAGFLSGTSLLEPPPMKGETPDELSVSRLVGDVATYAGTGDRTVLARDHWPDRAWPAVLASRLANDREEPVVHNQAVSMARAQSLESQVREAPASRVPTGAFFYIGYNDLEPSKLYGTPEALATYYESRYDRALKLWDSLHRRSTAYLVPLMDVHRAYEALHGFVWRTVPGRTYRCETSWNFLFPYGRFHAGQYRRGELESYSKERVNAMNSTLPRLAARWNEASERENSFVALDGLYVDALTPDLFAVDCYHLSSQGQSVFAQSVYEALSPEVRTALR